MAHSLADIHTDDLRRTIENAEPMVREGLKVYFNFENLSTNRSEYVVLTLDEMREELDRRTAR